MNKPDSVPGQVQSKQPGIEKEMHPKPEFDNHLKGSGKFKGKGILITGGDSGIGRAVAVAFANEGANIYIAYLDEKEDAEETKRLVETHKVKCHLIAGDIKEEAFCKKIVKEAYKALGCLDVIINNAAVQYPQRTLEDISYEQLLKTYSTNIFSYFLVTKYALPHLKKGASIINTTSVTAYRGSKELIDYSSTKGAIVAFTRSLSSSLAERGIRVNAVAPGPIWTPLIPASFPEEKVEEFGKQVPMQRPGQPDEVAPCYLFLASEENSYMTGQVLHPNGGEIING